VYLLYIYAYLRNKDSATAKAGTPYYIGKGKGNRAYAHHGKTPVPKDKSYIKFIRTNMSEQDAHQLEIALIAEHGRKDLNEGILLNMTDGGEGTSGLSDAAKAKMSNSLRGKLKSKETRAKMSAAKQNMTDETKEKIRKGNLGRKLSNETKALMSAKKKGKTWKLVDNKRVWSD
jgi:uncharacterized protein YdaL